MYKYEHFDFHNIFICINIQIKLLRNYISLPFSIMLLTYLHGPFGPNWVFGTYWNSIKTFSIIVTGGEPAGACTTSAHGIRSWCHVAHANTTTSYVPCACTFTARAFTGKHNLITVKMFNSRSKYYGIFILNKFRWTRIVFKGSIYYSHQAKGSAKSAKPGLLYEFYSELISYFGRKQKSRWNIF